MREKSWNSQRCALISSRDNTSLQLQQQLNVVQKGNTREWDGGRGAVGDGNTLHLDCARALHLLKLTEYTPKRVNFTIYELCKEFLKIF